MIDAGKLFEKNYIKNRKVKLRQVKDEEACYALKYSYKKLGAPEIKEIAHDLLYVKRTVINKIKKLYICFDVMNPLDKLVYILLEVMIYELLNNYQLDVKICMEDYTSNINTYGLEASPLGNYIINQDKDKFLKQFKRMVSRYNFRRVISIEEDGMEGSSILSSEVRSFLKIFNMDDERMNNVALAIGELVDNVYDHAESDCLVDIDVTEPNFTREDLGPDKVFYAVNVVVLNFSRKCLFEDVKNKFQNHLYESDERYDRVQKVIKEHQKYFCKDYIMDDFYTLTSFQKGISGRINETRTGGTGLSNFVCEIATKSEEDYCYMMTGSNGIFFRKRLLHYTEDGWIGFNGDNDFSKVPDKDVIFHTNTFLPGTAYNFLLVFGGEENGREEN